MKLRMRVVAALACALALSSTGCGKFTIKSWIKVITAESSGSLSSDVLGGMPIPLSRLSGGFLGTIVLDTRTLPGPVDGTVTVDVVRIAADSAPSIVGQICIWGNPAAPSTGTAHLDILGGTGSTTITLNLKASASLADMLGIPPVELSQSADFPLNGVGLTQLLNAATTGSADGLFQTSASFVGDTILLGAPASFNLDIKVTNEGKPPLFDADLLAACGTHFAEQGRASFYSVNSKASYLLASGTDEPAPPTIIPLADIGAHPGDQLKIARVGTYDDITELKDGNDTRVGALFSSTNVVKKDSLRNRIPGAIDAGTDFNTPPHFILLLPILTDIAQDFAVTNSPTVTVPAGANFLILGTVPGSMKWGDDSGFGFGVNVTVNP
jgi:hypothetical protein